MTGDIIYHTNRLFIKPVCIGDADFIFKLVNTESWIRYIGDRNVKTIEMAEKYIKERMLPQFKRLGFGNYVIFLKETGERVGTCGLYDREGLEGVDLGYALYPTFENNGYAFEASTKMLDLAFNEFGLEKVSGITSAENHASRKLMEKLSLKEKGTVLLENDPELLILYEIEKKEYLDSMNPADD